MRTETPARAERAKDVLTEQGVLERHEKNSPGRRPPSRNRVGIPCTAATPSKEDPLVASLLNPAA